MSFVCPWCNPGRTASQGTRFMKASRCSAEVRAGKKVRRCDGFVCGTCGQCQRMGEHK